MFSREPGNPFGGRTSGRGPRRCSSRKAPLDASEHDLCGAAEMEFPKQGAKRVEMKPRLDE